MDTTKYIENMANNREKWRKRVVEIGKVKQEIRSPFYLLLLNSRKKEEMLLYSNFYILTHFFFEKQYARGPN